MERWREELYHYGIKGMKWGIVSSVSGINKDTKNGGFSNVLPGYKQPSPLEKIRRQGVNIHKKETTKMTSGTLKATTNRVTKRAKNPLYRYIQTYPLARKLPSARKNFVSTHMTPSASNKVKSTLSSMFKSTSKVRVSKLSTSVNTKKGFSFVTDLLNRFKR